MKTLLFLPAALLFAIVCTGCGGGSSDEYAVRGALNDYEEALVGNYVLEDFRLYEPGYQPVGADQLEEWSGRLLLQGDRYAEFSMEFCHALGLDARVCKAGFAWSADTRWIHLSSLDPEVPDLELTWSIETGPCLVVESEIPDNRPNCGRLLVSDRGHELYRWVRAE